MNDLCEASAIANRKKKYTQPAHKKKYTTITTSRNKNNKKFSMCECTNENNKKRKIVLNSFFQS